MSADWTPITEDDWFTAMLDAHKRLKELEVSTEPFWQTTGDRIPQ
jgi:hypothetical protein